MGLSEWLERRRQRKMQEDRNVKKAAAWVIRLTPLLTKLQSGEEMRCDTCGEPITHDVLPEGQGRLFHCPKGCTKVAYDMDQSGRLLLDPRFFMQEGSS